MKRIKKAVCLATTTAIMLSNSAMAAGIQIGGYLDRTDTDVLLIGLRKGADKDLFSGTDVSFIQQQHVDKNGYFTMELPLDGSDYDYYSNAKFRTLPDTREGSIYVSSTGSDNNDGKTPEAPLQSFAEAYKQAALLNYEKIVIASDIDYEECPVSYDGTITIEGKIGNEKLDIQVNEDKYINIVGNTTFSNLVLSSTEQVNIFAQGNELKIDENVTTEQRLGVFGGKRRAKMEGNTNLTILGGKYVVICGGGLTGDVEGNTYVTVGGNVNEGDGIDDSNSATISPCYIWGGGGNASVLGETHVTLKDNAVAKYVCGSGEKTKGKEKKTYINIEGGKVMNVYGGSAKAGATDLENCDTHITMTGGMAESIFGGSEQNSMTGNTYINLKGGEVTRRVYTGCYNNYSGTWGSDNYVNGTTNLMLYPNAKVNTKNGLSSSNTSNVGVFSGSRTAEAHAIEKNTIIYMDNCMSKFETQIGDKSGWESTLKSFENYVVDVKSGGSVEPVDAGVIKILPDEGNVAYVDNNILETETLNISEGKTVVVEFSKPKETLNISIDYENEELTGFADGGSYKINGSDIVLTDNKYSVSSIISDEDKTLSIVKKGDSTGTSDSDAQELALPARPTVPDDIKIDNAAETITIPVGYKYGTTSANYADITSDGNGEAITVAPSESVYIYKTAVTDGENKAFKSAVKTVTAPSRKNIGEININFGAETINTAAAMQYSTDNGDTWNDCIAGNMPVTAFDGWDGTAEKSVKLRIPSDASNYGSEIKTVTIPVRPSAPKVMGVAPTVNGEKGKITGTTTAMEYKAVNGDIWTACSDSETLVSSGSYIVRVKATGTSFTGIATAAVTVPTFSAVKEDTPNITIDYNDETLAGFATSASYTIAVGENAAEAVTPEYGKLAINEKYIGKTISIVRKARDANYADSTAQTITLGSRAAQPANLTVEKPTSSGGKGKIIGTTADMQYKEKDNEQDTWHDCSEAETEVTAGKTYLIRAKAVTEGEAKQFASESIEAEVGEFVEPTKIKEDTPQIDIDYINEELNGFTAQQPYTIKVGDSAVQSITLGENVTAISIDEIDYIGEELLLEIVKNARDADSYTDSDAQWLTIPARPSAPNVMGTAPTENGGNGKIIGTTAEMEYKAVDENIWEDCSEAETEVTAGVTYIVRAKAVTDGETKSFASECAEVKVSEYVEPLGFTINSLKADEAENEGINVTADIELRGDIINGPHTIIAVYDEKDILIGVQFDYSMEQDVFVFNYKFESGKKYTIKAMIWNDNMLPLAKSYTIYFPENVN